MSFFMLGALVAGGITLSAQSSINGAFSRKAGTYESTFLTFATGAMMLSILILFFGQGNVLALFNAPAWQLSAVWFGVGYLFLTILAVPQIGVIATNIGTVIGQLTAGIVIDHFGWFGGIQVAFDWQRALAIVLMIVALRLVYVGSKKAEIEKIKQAA